MSGEPVEFDIHIYKEELEAIAAKEHREPTFQEVNEIVAKSLQVKIHGKSPKIEGNDDRSYRSELVVFEALMTFQAKLGTGTYNTQERARIADTIAKDANKKIRGYWERDK